MIGDDLGNDIEPARQVGLHTYWIVDTDRADHEFYPDLHGTLADCLAWVQEGGLRKL